MHVTKGQKLNLTNQLAEKKKIKISLNVKGKEHPYREKTNIDPNRHESLGQKSKLRLAQGKQV